MYEILPYELKPLADLANRLASKPIPRRKLDAEVHVVIHGRAHHNPPHYTADLDVALSLIPDGWWWHMSHLEVQVIPNSPEPDMPISNATDYHINGRPIGYTCPLWGVRKALPSAICAVMMLAKCALRAKQAAIANKRMYLIQTGDGPLLVDRDGTLKELPLSSWLSADGRLIARKEALPHYDFEEPSPDED